MPRHFAPLCWDSTELVRKRVLKAEARFHIRVICKGEEEGRVDVRFFIPQGFVQPADMATPLNVAVVKY